MFDFCFKTKKNPTLQFGDFLQPQRRKSYAHYQVTSQCVCAFVQMISPFLKSKGTKKKMHLIVNVIITNQTLKTLYTSTWKWIKILQSFTQQTTRGVRARRRGFKVINFLKNKNFLVHNLAIIKFTQKGCAYTFD